MTSPLQSGTREERRQHRLTLYAEQDLDSLARLLRLRQDRLARIQEHELPLVIREVEEELIADVSEAIQIQMDEESS
jgi:hypothetical protein